DHTLNALKNDKNNFSHWQALVYAYSQGGTISWSQFFDSFPKMVDIPASPLKRQRFWPHPEIQVEESPEAMSSLSLEQILEKVYENQKMPSATEIDYILKNLGPS